MQVPLLDLKAQYAAIRDEMMPAIEAVMESQHFIGGPQVRELEEAVAEYCQATAAVGVSSGTDALLAGLMTLGVGAGDEVITTPYTFFATVGAIWRVGARPVFVDIQPDTFNIDPAGIDAAVTGRTKAIMPVHLFGQMADMEPIMAVAREHELYVIEDAAQAIGATCGGRKAGSIGTIGCFSFYPSKNLGGLGDGGIITTQDEELADRLRQCRNHGCGVKYFHEWVGGNFRLDTLQAAGLLVKLGHLDAWSAGRRANAALYDELFADIEPLVTPKVAEGNVSIYNQYVIRVPRRDELREFLTDSGIGTMVYYPLSLHQQECFAELGYKGGDFPVSERAAVETLALPIYPELTDEQIVYVAEKIGEFLD
ncbi:MAG: DegT/DnrJ/EryC1/StrS family aminotransferase [Phycisphaerae bacterium]